MKTQPLSRYLSPIFVFGSGVVGGIIAYSLFIYDYPKPDDAVGQAFSQPTPYWMWVFLMMFTSCLITILLFPSWGILIGVFQRYTQKNNVSTRWEIFKLFIISVLVAAIVLLLFRVMRSINVGIHAYFPHGHLQRINFMIAYSFMAILPAGLTVLLLYSSAQETFRRNQFSELSESQLLILVGEMQTHRSLLQLSLILAGSLLSMIPLVAAGTRANLIALNPQIEQSFPMSYVILFGLIFTIILLLVYVPTHITLSEISRNLRDSIYPLDSVSDIKETIEKRKILDELLQTNVGVWQNVKSGMVTLTPLVSSLVVSLLGINVV